MGSAVPSVTSLRALTPEQTAAEAPESTQASAADAQPANNEPVSPVAAAASSPPFGAVASVAGCTQSSLSAALRASSDDGTKTSESASATAGCSGDTIGLVACPAEDPGRVEIWGLQVQTGSHFFCQVADSCSNHWSAPKSVPLARAASIYAGQLIIPPSIDQCLSASCIGSFTPRLSCYPTEAICTRSTCTVSPSVMHTSISADETACGQAGAPLQVALS